MLSRQLRKERLRIWITVLLVLAALNGALFFIAQVQRQVLVDEALNRSRDAAHIVQLRAESLLDRADSVLAGIGEVMAARGGLRPVPDIATHRLLVRRHAQTDGLRWLLLARTDGSMAETSTVFPVTPLSVADRDYFSLQRDDWDVGLYLGAPLVSRLRGQSFIPISRRVINDGGLFLGVVAAGLNPEMLVQLIDSQSLPDGYQAGIFLKNGQALACSSSICEVKSTWLDTPLFQRWLPSGAGSQVRGEALLDETPAVGHWDMSERYPLIVAVQVPQVLLEDAWKAYLTQYLPFVVGLNLVVLGMAFVACWQFRRRRDALLALATANAELEKRVQERTDLLRLSEARARAFMNTALDAVVVVDAVSHILEFNPAAERMFGYCSDEVRGQSLSLLMPEDEAPHHRAVLQAANGEEAVRIMGKGREVQARRRDGSRFPIEVTVGSAREAGEVIHVGIIRDITERKNAEWQLQRLATIDSLTGILNRRAFMEHGAQLVALAQRHQHPLAVLMLDADRFKSVNDTHGHHVGDQVLQLLVSSVTAMLRSTDIFGRLGGEEFGLILPETDLPGVQELGERLLQSVRAARLPLEDGQELQFTVSMGGALLTDTDGNLDELFRRADGRLYEAKHGGRDRLVLGE